MGINTRIQRNHSNQTKQHLEALNNANSVYSYIDADTDIDNDAKYDILNKQIDGLKKQLLDETNRANKMQNLMEQKSNQLITLQDEISNLKSKKQNIDDTKQTLADD